MASIEALPAEITIMIFCDCFEISPSTLTTLAFTSKTMYSMYTTLVRDLILKHAKTTAGKFFKSALFLGALY